MYRKDVTSSTRLEVLFLSQVYQHAPANMSGVSVAKRKFATFISGTVCPEAGGKLLMPTLCSWNSLLLLLVHLRLYHHPLVPSTVNQDT